MNATMTVQAPSKRSINTAATVERKRLTPDQQKLVEDEIDFAEAIARSMAKGRDWHVEPFIASAYAGLVDAASTFDASLGYKFQTHAQPRIVGQIQDDLRSQIVRGFRRHNREDAPKIVSMNRGYYSGGDSKFDHKEIMFSDTFASEEDRPDADDGISETVEKLAKGLPAGNYAEAFRLFYGKPDMTMKKVAGELGLSESRVSQMITMALQAIRDRVAVEGDKLGLYPPSRARS